MAHDPDTGDLGAIDRLLAETDQGWDVEAQVLTLKQAAASRPPIALGGDTGEPVTASRHTVSIPTPFELGPAQMGAMIAGSAGGLDLPTLKISRTRRTSKGPPPSKVPPPLRRKGPPPLPPPSTRTPEAPSARQPPDLLQPSVLCDLLHARLATLEGRDDKIGLARAHLELAIAHEVTVGDDARATMHAEAALRVNPALSPAHSMLRRKKHGRTALASMLGHLEQELFAAPSGAHKVELLAEKARLIEAIGDRGNELRSTWEQVLAQAPHHAGALKGLEVELHARAEARGAPADWEDWELLAAHLGRMAEAYGSDTRLAAWLHVERAQVLERKLGRVDAARGSLERALELDPSVGPVRDALVRHVAACADWGGLVRLLDDEARIEHDASRAARLELDAALVAVARLGDRPRACVLLERAAARAPTVASVDRRVLDELVRLYELQGQWTDATRARRSRIGFVSDPAAIAYELRALAAAAEKDGDLETAIADVHRALALDARDPTLADMLDRLLKAADKHEQRIALWLQEAARTVEGVARARALARAASVCEELGRRPDAIRHLRSAWVSAPGDGEVLDALARQLAPSPTDAVDSGPRALVDLYVQAAEHAPDVGRKVAFLERVGLLWEDLLGDPMRAARTYEQVLELDGNRQSALLGLERTAARLGEPRALARALLDEARLAADAATQLTLRTRAAGALAEQDPSRATQIVREVLDHDSAHAAARALETQLEARAGRWETVAKSLRARVEAAPSTPEKVALWLALAQVQDGELHRPLDALGSLEQACALDPDHPVPPQQIARVMDDHGDARALRDAVERIATRAATPEDRARHLARTAEIDELRLGDDAAAIRTLQRALAEAPEDDLVAERLARLVARRAQRGGEADLGELATLLGKRIERAPTPEAARTMSFHLATLLLEIGREPMRAASLLEGTLTEQVDHVPTLRALESLRRRSGDTMALARVLDKQGDRLGDVRARLGALWGLASLEEWRLSTLDPGATYRRILELDPTDPGALEATLRCELGDARSGDPRALQSIARALRALVSLASDDDTRFMLQLLLAVILEKAAGQAAEVRVGEELLREALGRYRDVLRIDELSVTAATGVARLASRFRDAEAAFAAARSLAEIAVEPRVRARYLVDAAELLLDGTESEPLGLVAASRPERHKLAATILGRALEADPDSIAAAGRLASVLLDEDQGERLVSAFRDALARATSPDAAVMLGSEIARIARDELQDLTVAIDAIRRVRAAAPQHVPSLLTLAELCIAQRVWPEAVDALETVVSTAHEVSPKLTALFALASIYEKVLARPREVDRVLRAAVALDPSNARALGGLIRRMAAEPVEEDAEAKRARRSEIADLLGRLADVEKGNEQKTGILIELADVRGRLGDPKAAERALVEAVAGSPSNAHAYARLAALFDRPSGRDDVGHARALTAVIARGDELGVVDARWFATLGRLEIQALSRTRDGISHLQRAAAMDPTLYEARYELACAYERVGANEEATRTLVGMLAPAARPLLSIPNPALALALLEKTLSAERRSDEALVVTELRALSGDLDEVRRNRLHARRLPALHPERAALDRPALVTQVLPAEGRHILLEVAAAIAGVEAKVARADLAEIGVSPRDRITSRDRQPVRALLDRIARQLGVGDVELVITPGVVRTRVLAQDVPWIVVPAALVDLPESAQAASLARALARIAYGVPWLEELPPQHVEALLVAAARQVVPSYGTQEAGTAMAQLVTQYEARLARGLSRRHRKVLEELAPHIASPQSRPLPIDQFIGALLRAELRAAFVLLGDLLAVIDELRPLDAALQRATASPGRQALIAVLEHPIAGDLARFALTPEATALRRRLGTTWAA
jgi:tetratricopeptide (TPR) repeat protein